MKNIKRILLFFILALFGMSMMATFFILLTYSEYLHPCIFIFGLFFGLFILCGGGFCLTCYGAGNFLLSIWDILPKYKNEDYKK